RRFTLYSKGIQEGSRVKWRIIREGAVPVTIEAEFGETGKIRTYRPTQGGAAMCIDVAVPDPNHPSRVPAIARAWLCRRQGYAVEYLVYAAIAALVMIAIRARHLPAAAWIAIALLAAMALSRFVLFTLID